MLLFCPKTLTARISENCHYKQEAFCAFCWWHTKHEEPEQLAEGVGGQPGEQYLD